MPGNEITLYSALAIRVSITQNHSWDMDTQLLPNNFSQITYSCSGAAIKPNLVKVLRKSPLVKGKLKKIKKCYDRAISSSGSKKLIPHILRRSVNPLKIVIGRLPFGGDEGMASWEEQNISKCSIQSKKKKKPCHTFNTATRQYNTGGQTILILRTI